MSQRHRALPIFRIGCTGVILVLILVAGGYFFLYPILTPDRIRGDLIDCVIVPQNAETGRLWILTDGSFNYISSTKTPGRYSIGRKCLSCKAWIYEYDPVREKVIRKIKVKYDDIIMNAGILYSKGTVYHVADAYRKGEARVLLYDAATGTMVGDTKSFISRHPELSGGITKARLDKNNRTMEFDTRDGKTNLVYSSEDERVYPSYSSFLDEQRKDTRETDMFFLCSEDSHDARKLLYRATGPRRQLLDRRSALERNCSGNMKHITRHIKGFTTQRMQDLVFLQGMIYHQDDEGAIIIHLNQTGRKADRIITCVDHDGKIKWTVPQSELFDQLKIDEDRDVMTRVDLSKDKIAVLRSGNMVVLEVYQLGLIGFDHKTGKKIFTVN